MAALQARLRLTSHSSPTVTRPPEVQVLYCHMSAEAGQGHHPKAKRTAVNITGNSAGDEEEERPDEARASSEHPHGQHSPLASCRQRAPEVQATWMQRPDSCHVHEMPSAPLSEQECQLLS